MKTRNGLVSNSSSSSFVVAFPKKPTTGADVWNFMFKGKDGGLSAYDNDGLSFSQVSENVFSSLKDKKFKKATLKDIVVEFEQRYHYIVESNNTMWYGKITDKDGGSWYYKIDKYCGSDPKLLEELRQEIIKSENLWTQLREEETEILKRGPKEVECAYKGGKNFKSERLYTEAEIAAYDKYLKLLEKFKETDKEYIDYSKRRMKYFQNKQIDILKKKLATVDAKAFLKNNEGKFIFIVSYSDNDGSVGSTMEHGNIFRHVPHETISHH